MKAHVIATVWIISIIAGSASAQGQKPVEGASATQHQQALEGLTDVQFASMMVKHHQDGIEMARLEEQRGSSASVKSLAAKIRQSQEKDLLTLKTHAGHNSGSTATSEHDKMMEQQSQTVMARLKSASGPALDHAFLEEMAKHHEQAIKMTERAKLRVPELQKLAQKMMTGQRLELAELKKLLAAHGK
jgi:uncharacterized protein (DUF305 family)